MCSNIQAGSSRGAGSGGGALWPPLKFQNLLYKSSSKHSIYYVLLEFQNADTHPVSIIFYMACIQFTCIYICVLN